jgi:hypothetical protein
VEGSCEYGNEPSASIKCWEILEYLSNQRLLKKGSARCSSLGGLTFSSGNSASHPTPALQPLRFRDQRNGEAVLFNNIISVESPGTLAQAVTLPTCKWRSDKSLAL